VSLLTRDSGKKQKKLDKYPMLRITVVSLTAVLDIMPNRIEWTAVSLRMHGELGGGFSLWISET